MLFFACVMIAIVGIGIAACNIHPVVYVFAVMIGIVGIESILREG